MTWRGDLEKAISSIICASIKRDNPNAAANLAALIGDAVDVRVQYVVNAMRGRSVRCESPGVKDPDVAAETAKPAFPVDLTNKTGLTKRELYACALMAAIIQSDIGSADRMARDAVKYADALSTALAPAQPVNDNESGGKE